MGLIYLWFTFILKTHCCAFILKTVSTGAVQGKCTASKLQHIALWRHNLQGMLWPVDLETG